MKKIYYLILSILFFSQAYTQPVVSYFSPTTGGPRTRIDIYGSNFAGVSDVKINGVSAANFYIYSQTHIQFLPGPNVTGLLDISVVSPIGTATAPNFNFKDEYAPKITGISNLNPSPGSTVTITGYNFNDVTGVSFGYIPASSFILVDTTRIDAVYAGGNMYTAAWNIVHDTSYYDPVYSPKISGFAPTTGTSGTTVTITGQNLFSVTNVLFGNSPATSFTYVNPNMITAVVGKGASGTVIVEDYSCATTLPGFTYVPPAPPAIAPSGANPVTGTIEKATTVDAEIQTLNNTPYVQRHYDIEPQINPATSTATLTLFFLQDDFDKYNASPNHGVNLPTGPGDIIGISNFRIYQYHGTSVLGIPGSYESNGIAINPDDDKIVWNVSSSVWEVTFDVTGFSGFFASSSSFALPVTLISFSGQLKSDEVLLQWETDREINFDHFNIEKSNDGNNFEKIATIQSLGTTQTIQRYQYREKPGSAQVYYYRLKMIDKDESYSYSKVVSIKSNQRSKLLVRD